MRKRYKIPNHAMRAFLQREYEKFICPLLGIPWNWRRFFRLDYWRIRLFTKWEKPGITDIDPRKSQEIEIVSHRRGLANLTGRRK